MSNQSVQARCLQLTKFYPPYNGGIETTARDIAEGLVHRDWNVEVLCANSSNTTSVEQGRVPVTRVASFGQMASTSMTPALTAHLSRRAKSCDVIHVHLPNPMANLALFLARPRAKIVVHWHSDIVKQKLLLKFYAPLQNWLLKRADAIIATSPPYAESSRWLAPFAHKIKFVPSCVRDPNLETDSQTRRKHADEIRNRYQGKKIVFALGRMTYYKGFDVLLRAAQKLEPDVVVLLGGQGELLETLKEQAENLGVVDRVHFLGKVPDDQLAAYYESADVFCLPSLVRSEAFGLVMVEAMSYGKPVVATDIHGSGVPWVNIHEKTGLNVEPGNAEQLALALQCLLNDPAKAQILGASGRQRFEHYFTVEKMIDAIEDIYEDVLALQRVGPLAVI